MTLALDSSAPPFKTQDGVNTFIETASFTPPAGSRLWALCAWDDSGTNLFTVSSTPSLTWTEVQEQAGPGAVLAWADVTTSQSYVVRVDVTAGSFSGQALQVFVITGGETTPGGAMSTIDSPGGVAPTLEITTNQANSLILAVASGWNGSGTDWTAGTTQTLLNNHKVLNNYRSAFWRYNGLPVAGSYTLDLLGSTEQHAIIAIEIRELVISGPVLTAELWEKGTNLLTSDEQSFESASAWEVETNCTLAQSATQAKVGTKSLAITSVASGDMSVRSPGGTSGKAVTVGTSYGLISSLRPATTARSVWAYLNWFDSGGGYLSTNSFGPYDEFTGKWAEAWAIGVAPTSAAHLQGVVRILATGGASEVHHLDDNYLGYLVKTNLGTEVVTAEGIYTFIWDASVLADISGANVELRLTTDVSSDYDAIEWEAYKEEVSAVIESWGMAIM